MTKFCQLWLTCKDEKEASKIAKSLIDKHLIACYGKLAPYSGKYWWRGKVEQADEVFLGMLSRLDLFDEIEQEITGLHSYDIFVLEAIPIVKISKKAKQWLNSELKNGK